MKSQISRIIKHNSEIFDHKLIYNPDSISDIKDGEIYRDFIETECLGTNLTFTIFTDGISVSNKSSITVWPIILAINELPKEKRFCIDQLIIAGNHY